MALSSWRWHVRSGSCLSSQPKFRLVVIKEELESGRYICFSSWHAIAVKLPVFDASCCCDRPAAEGGQPAQIGRKAVGDCAQLFDKTWIQIGLRK